MPSCLPINIDDLLHFRGVESARVEFKQSWNEGPTAQQALHTICAFANDFYNVNGGYIIIGVAEQNGSAVLPPVGVEAREIERMQKWVRGNCRRIDPEYQPILSPEVVDGKHILVIWVPGSDVRPHQAPVTLSGGERAYYVRLGPETVEAQGQVLTDLLAMAMRVPFDDRRAAAFGLTDLRATLVREFLADVRSDLLNETDDAEVYRCMRITARVNGHEVPRNAGLLFFSDDPEKAFPGARIEVAHFANGPSADLIEEPPPFKGPLPRQIRDCLRYLANLSTSLIEKQHDRAETTGWVSFPLPALEEALVNAVYHRSYDGVYEPTKVYLFPDRIEITSYPGPVPGLRREDFSNNARVPNVPLRNRRIGEFLKELRLAEARGTGVPKVFRSMAENGSPIPRFEFDESRSYFTAVLPAHPEYVALSALREAASLAAVGDRAGAIRRLEAAHAALPSSGSVAAQLIEELARDGDLVRAQKVFDDLRKQPQRTFEARVVAALADAYLNSGKERDAKRVLDMLPAVTSHRDAIEPAILERRAGRQREAHRLFEQAGEAVFHDARALHEFAQTKMRLAASLRRARKRYERDAGLRFLRQAKELLQRVIQLDAPPTRRAWAWFDLGRVRELLGEPESDIRGAFQEASNLLPGEPRFRKALQDRHDQAPG